MMFDDIPEKAVEIIQEGKKMKPGASLVRISSDISRPSAKDIGFFSFMRHSDEP